MARTIKLNSGYEMPTIGLGTWQAAPGEVERAVAEAVDAGYRHFDCAMLYGNEREIGAALRAKMDEGALWNTFHRPEVVEATCRRSLEALQLDYLDLYLVHWPVAFKEGEEPWPRDAQGRIHTTYIEPASTWRAMERLPALGLARSVGVSNFNSQQLARLCDAAQLPPAVNQVECHPYLTQRALRAACRARGVTVVAYSPLGAPNAVRPATTEAALGAPAVLHDHRIKELAAKYAKSPAQIILRYLVQSGMAAIPKSTNPTRLRENLDIYDFELAPAELQFIDTFNCGVRAYPLLEVQHDVNYPFHIE
ncbi:AAEL004086-PA [Gryllus bimaculatus]|nr:AAEL004086-PA [Gryllus bimaculatus]